MILFDPEQREAAEGFPRFSLAAAGRRAALPSKSTLTRYLREAQSAVGLAGEVSVLLTTDEGIRLLNRRFRKKNKATDVLSFPVPTSDFDLSFGIAGDLAVSVETAARQAEEQGHSLAVELRVLMLHGLLHLAGMDHEADAGEMARIEGELREKMGLPVGLIERAEGRDQGSGIRDQKSQSRFPTGMTERKAKAKTKTEANKTEAKAEVDSGRAAAALARGAR